ncbi:GGDEF domain-containing protein [Sphingomonas sp. FW199]|uniref:GGDEF domain-containing protein n=1 Tax=Sphingomonas sp. FW199 TaxID=3400217 RepID=UPI003CF8F9E3
MASQVAMGSAGKMVGSDGLFRRIGSFLTNQRLDPNPANYTFAYHVVADPDGPIAKAVAALTDGGVRLTAREVDSIGGHIEGGSADSATTLSEQRRMVEGLVARTQMQVQGFEDMMRDMQAETADFGRDLAESAAAIATPHSDDETFETVIDKVKFITGTMLERVRVAESRLDLATREASELRAKLEEARDNARRDPLTDLPNRRAFEEAFQAQAATGEPLIVAICDIDHFKAVNDQFGHAVGDRVLKAIGQALAGQCTGHFVARHGGEEFAILFTGIEPGEAERLLDTCRHVVARKRYRLRETDMPVGELTFSGGMTCILPGEPLAEAFQRADVELYRAKESGRNQICTDW